MLKKIILSICILIASFSYVNTHAADSSGDLSSTDFTINVGSISPGGGDLVENDAETTINNTFERIIRTLIIAMGTISLLITIIGAWFMILYTGEDERLTKWKTIFSAWLVSLAVALLSWLMVQLISYLIYI